MAMPWSKFLDGDIHAFQDIYVTYVDDLYAYGISFYPDKELVLDCIHDLFVQLFDNKKIAREVNIKFYLFASLKRNILKKKRELDKYYHQESMEEWEYMNSYEMNFCVEEGDKQRLLRIQDKLKNLPKRQREVIYLKYYIELSYEEIAEIMKVDISSCRTLSFRAIRQLRLELSTLKSFFIFF